MSQKRKAYKDIKTKILQDLCKTYEQETTVYGIERLKKEANARNIPDKTLVRIIDRIYIEVAISISQTYYNIRRIHD